MRLATIVALVIALPCSAQQLVNIHPGPPRATSIEVSPYSALRPATGAQNDPAIASDGVGALVVWSDNRYGNFDVFASRMSADGEVLDPGGIPIAPSWADDVGPDVIWDGVDYLVIWTNLLGLFGARVSRDGTVTSLGALVDTPGLSYGAVATNGNQYLVVFTTIGAGQLTLSGQLLDRGGHPTGSRLTIAPAGSASFARIASNGDSFVVVWREGIATLSRRVDRDGTLGERRILGSSAFSRVAIDYAQGQYVVAWADKSPLVITLDNAGNPSGPSVAFGRPGEFASFVDIASIAAGYVLTWISTTLEFGSVGALTTQPITRSLTPAAPPAAVADTPNGASTPAITSTVSGVIVAWADLRFGTRDIFSAPLDSIGRANGPARIVSQSIPNQTSPALATIGNVVMVVWREQVASDIWAIAWRRFDISGRPLDAAASILPRRGGVAGAPAVAASRDRFLIVWDEVSQAGAVVSGARVTAGGQLLDDTPIAVSNNGSEPAVASNGDAFLVVYTRRANPPLTSAGDDIYSVRVTADGSVSANNTLLSDQTAVADSKPRVTWNGVNYFVVWTAGFNARARFIAAPGVLINGLPMSFPLGRLSGGPSAVASSNSNQLFVTEVASSPSYIVNNDGTYALGPNAQPYVVFNGREYVSAPVPLAAIGTNEVVVAYTLSIPMIPEAHNGGVQRVLLQFLPVRRSRGATP